MPRPYVQAGPKSGHSLLPYDFYASLSPASEGASVPSIATQQQSIAPEPDIPSEWLGSMPYNTYSPASYGSTASPSTTLTSYDYTDPAPAAQPASAGNSFWGGLGAAFNNPAQNNPAQSNPANDIYYSFRPQSQPTLQDYGQNIGYGLNNWLMNSYMTAPSNIYQATNDAWAQQSNINANNQFRNNLLSAITGMMGSFGGGNGGGFHDTASNQAAGGNSYTTSINAGGMDRNLADGAVQALQNAHPGTNSQHGDLRRAMAANSANNLNRMERQAYAQQQGQMEGQRAGEGQQLAGYNANQIIQRLGNQGQLLNMLMPQLMRGLR